ncbi:hypothetical protein GCM10009624_01790 [Gordonia sinesedis]
MVRTTEVTTPLWATATALVAILVLAWVFGAFARWLLRGRARLDNATCIVLAILGSAIGLYIVGAVDRRLQVWSPLTVVVALIGSVLAVAAYGAVATRIQGGRRDPIGDLLRDGESARVEFKSTARINLRTGEKDSRMEQVIAKTVAAFLNADGGTLLIGVDDEGTPLGLDPDYATLKTPDADRFELWLRDLFGSTLGQNAAASVDVSVESIVTDDGPREVCRVISSPSPRPVYLRPGKNAAPEFWVRSGNSTRQLPVDTASEYIAHRWPLPFGAAIAAQAKSAVRFSAER